MENEKQLYRILAQKEGFTATIETKEITFEEAKEVAMKQIKMIDEDLNFKPFVVLPITTQVRYETGCINFCPR